MEVAGRQQRERAEQLKVPGMRSMAGRAAEGLDLADRLQGHAGVDGGGVELLVAEQDLDDAEVGPALQKVSGEAVPERVHGHALVEPGGLGRSPAGAI